ncbi:hypothetical protein DQ04_00981170 [Trypanosoma grayi]|uniref:hypothetical protein n=1 Tax=Trypanosoma grayi TaxID=71804 RepID=UPI0004F411A1|nr:hypothetical protein DQ04_00981170 [Trypanosoma grayi]KEG13487.1 hypothetical protein DQ04_00981170 [Trypanosoma grayi]
MSEKGEGVVLEATTTLLAQHFTKLLQHYHNHILFLEDAFFGAAQQKQEVFDTLYAFELTAGASRPLIQAPIEGSEQRLQQLLRMFQTACENEVTVFCEEGEALKQQMARAIVTSEEKWKLAERRRQYDFMELCVSCQKDVAAITAELRSGVLSYFQDRRMGAVLQEALDAKEVKLQELQHQLEEVTELRLREFTEQQNVVQEEREKYRQRFVALQKETAGAIEEFTLDAERQHQQHLREVQEMQRQCAAREEVLEKQLHAEREGRVAECKLREEKLEQCREAVKKLEGDKTRLTQETVELQTQVGEWRCRYSERDSRARVELLEHQALADVARVEEAQAFRKRLVSAVRRGTSSAPLETLAVLPVVAKAGGNGRGSSRSSGVFVPTASPVAQANCSEVSRMNGGSHSLFVTPMGSMQARNAAADCSIRLSCGDEKRRPSASPLASEDAANPFSNLALHSPTASYVKLMNLSEQLKRHIQFN